MFKLMPLFIITALAFLLLISCVSSDTTDDESEPPEFVFVPDSGFHQTVVVRASDTTVQVGEPVVLTAVREAGPFIRVPYASFAEDICWWERQPPEHEAEVAANLRWEVQPGGMAPFNTEPREDLARSVIFSQPGTYQLRGHSAVWCSPGTWSNSIEIRVVPKPAQQQ